MQNYDEKKAEDRRINTLMEERAWEWEQAGRPVKLLLHGRQLDQIVRWLHNCSTNQQPLPTLRQIEYFQESMFENLPRTLEPYLTNEEYDIRKPTAAIKPHLRLMHELVESEPESLPKVCEEIIISMARLRRLATGLEWLGRELLEEAPEYRRQQLSTLVRYASHDILGPLRFIWGNAELMNIRVAERQLDDLPGFLDRFDVAIAQLTMLVDQCWHLMTDYSSDSL